MLVKKPAQFTADVKVGDRFYIAYDNATLYNGLCTVSKVGRFNFTCDTVSADGYVTHFQFRKTTGNVVGKTAPCLYVITEAEVLSQKQAYDSGVRDPLPMPVSMQHIALFYGEGEL